MPQHHIKSQFSAFVGEGEGEGKGEDEDEDERRTEAVKGCCKAVCATI